LTEFGHKRLLILKDEKIKLVPLHSTLTMLL